MIPAYIRFFRYFRLIFTYSFRIKDPKYSNSDRNDTYTEISKYIKWFFRLAMVQRLKGHSFTVGKISKNLPPNLSYVLTKPCPFFHNFKCSEAGCSAVFSKWPLVFVLRISTYRLCSEIGRHVRKVHQINFLKFNCSGEKFFKIFNFFPSLCNNTSTRLNDC